MINCKYVYPCLIIRPIDKYKGIDTIKHLKWFIDSILEQTEKIIKQLVGDNPKRSWAKNCMCHSSYYPCEYCFARGVLTPIDTQTRNDKKKNFAVEKNLIAEKLRNAEDLTAEEVQDLKKLEKNVIAKEKQEMKKKSSRITWPACTANSQPRTRENISEILENIDVLTPQEKKGIIGRSVLFDIPRYNFVRDTPAEYMHSTCLGVIKRLVELTFSVGEVRPRKTNRKLSDPKQFNVLMRSIKNFKECSRRARDLDFSVLKAAEFRDLALLYFPLIVECIEDEQKERDLWLHIAFMVRACILPSEEFRYVDLNEVTACSMRFYKMYEAIFGRLNCTYNTHVVFSHITEIRAHGPLTETSAFVFESFYGEMKKCFVPGTNSPLKQILQKVLLKRSLSNHCCEIPIYFSNRETSLENDTLIYVWENNRHNMYLIKEVFHDELLCTKINKEVVEFDECPMLEWKTVGVYKKTEDDNASNDDVIIEKKKVSGKVIKVLNLLITCPNNVLREK